MYDGKECQTKQIVLLPQQMSCLIAPAHGLTNQTIWDAQWWKQFTKTRKRFPYLSTCYVLSTTLRKPILHVLCLQHHLKETLLQGP